MTTNGYETKLNEAKAQRGLAEHSLVGPPEGPVLTFKGFLKGDYQEQKPERLADQLLPRFGARNEAQQKLEVEIGRQGAHVSAPGSKESKQIQDLFVRLCEPAGIVAKLACS